MNKDTVSSGLAEIAAALDPSANDPWTPEEWAEFRELWETHYGAHIASLPEEIREETMQRDHERMREALDAVRHSRAAIVGSTLIHNGAGMVARSYPGVDLEEI